MVSSENMRVIMLTTPVEVNVCEAPLVKFDAAAP